MTHPISGVETPTFYVVRYQDTHYTVALRTSNQYLFHIDGCWYSTDIESVDTIVQQISQADADQLKAQVQSADKSALRLLMISKSLFNRLSKLLNTLDVPTIKVSISAQINNMFPLTIEQVRMPYAIAIQPWKELYINKLIKSRGLAPTISQWDLLVGPQRYIFGKQSKVDTSIRLMQLHRAIEQIKDDTSASQIYKLSQDLDASIGKFNFDLPDLCIRVEYAKCIDANQNDLIKKGLILIAHLARLGVANGQAEVGNLGEFDGQLNFKSYDKAILAADHGEPFAFAQVESIMKRVYPKQQAQIASNPIVAFNCMVMYDAITLILSIGSKNELISDANDIMKQVFNENPTFKFDANHTAIDWIYEKHFERLPEFDQLLIQKSNDSHKYAYLLEYARQFDFGQ